MPEPAGSGLKDNRLLMRDIKVAKRDNATEPAEAGLDDEAGLPARSSTVQSVEVAVRILEAIAESGGAVRVSEMARLLGMTKARVSRHLQTLLGLGLVAKGAQEGYVFGWKLLQLGRAAVRDRTVTELAKPHLQRLRDALQQTVVLSLPHGEGSVVVLCVESRQQASVAVRPGTFLEFPKSPAARLSVALQSDAASLLGPRNGRGHADAGAALASLTRLREDGVDFEVDTQGTGLGGVAVPVFDEGGKLAGVVSLVMPSRLLAPRPSTEMVRALRQCAADIEAEYRQGAAPA